jgi:hypothetical protein
MKRVTIAFLTLALVGCVGSTEGDKRLVHQNIGAAKAILLEPALGLAVMGPARDILANSLQLQENLGPPKDPKPYTPDTSKADREKSKEEHATPWWQIALVGAGSLLLGVLRDRIPLLSLLSTLMPKAIGGKIGTALVASTEGVARVREEIRSRPDGQKSISELDLLAILNDVQEDAGVQTFVADLAHKAEAKLATKM